MTQDDSERERALDKAHEQEPHRTRQRRPLNASGAVRSMFTPTVTAPRPIVTPQKLWRPGDGGES